MNNKPLICALDIGSTKVSILVAEATSDGFKVIGTAKVLNQGLRQGSIVDIGKTTDAIRRAKREAELSSGRELSEAYVSFGGLYVRSFDSDGMVAVADKEVSQLDVDNVLKTAQAVVLPEDREIIHVLPKEFILDGQSQIDNPVGMQGVRLETNVHLITGVRTAFPNMMKCVESAGLKVKEFVLEQYASSICVLNQEEKELGVCLVDIGGGTSNWIIYLKNKVVATGAVPVGGINFTQDISIGLRTAPKDAERIKIEHGHCLPAAAELEEQIDVPDVGGRGLRTVQKRNLCEIVSPRAQETLKLILDDIENSGFKDQLGAGLVLTGGASQLTGLVDYATYNFETPIRMGAPHITTNINEAIDSAELSCGVGLLEHAYSKYTFKDVQRRVNKSSSSSSSVEDSFKNFGRHFKEFIGL